MGNKIKRSIIISIICLMMGIISFSVNKQTTTFLMPGGELVVYEKHVPNLITILSMCGLIGNLSFILYIYSKQ